MRLDSWASIACPRSVRHAWASASWLSQWPHAAHCTPWQVHWNSQWPYPAGRDPWKRPCHWPNAWRPGRARTLRGLDTPLSLPGQTSSRDTAWRACPNRTPFLTVSWRTRPASASTWWHSSCLRLPLQRVPTQGSPHFHRTQISSCMCISSLLLDISTLNLLSRINSTI